MAFFFFFFFDTFSILLLVLAHRLDHQAITDTDSK